MRVLKWTTVKEYYSETTGEQITKHEAQKNYIPLKTITDVEKIIKKARDTGETYAEATKYIRTICTRRGKQIEISFD